MIGRIAHRLRTLGVLCRSLAWGALAALPNDPPFCRARAWFLRRTGKTLGPGCVIFRNVTLLGKVSLGVGCSISNNSFINGWTEGVTLGDHVMIAPNCVIVAFNHGFADTARPMLEQPCEGSPVIIGHDVWIGANCTVTAGVSIGSGCIIGANSVVTKDIPDGTIAAGVPARPLKSRWSNLA
jgi:acetyltransferase-like isoleucine patch superfamily enzyme